jgi:DNA adenine methylase
MRQKRSEREHAMTKVLTHPLKWAGGKNYLAAHIVKMMPKHRHYVEAYAGGASVLLERDPNDKALWVAPTGPSAGVSEVLNDLNGELVNFWRILRSPTGFPKFLRRCQATPLSRTEFERAGEVLRAEGPDSVVRAWAFFVRARQSRAGDFKGFTSLTRSRTRRGVNGNVSEWLGAVDGLPAIHDRLRPVVLENMDALTLIRREDTPETLFYLDPPYLHETRTAKDLYAHEMTRDQHVDLLDVLAGLRGKFLLSGYHSALYDATARRHGWECREFNLANHQAGGDTKRRMVECVWSNIE